MSFIKDSGTMEKAFGATTVLKEYNTWVDLLSDYKFFTPAILYWHTGLDRDLVSDFINQQDLPPDLRPQRVITGRNIGEMENSIVPLKQGLSVVTEDLAKMLYVCPNKSEKEGEPTIWERLDSFITSISFVDVKTGFYAQAMKQQDLMIFDLDALSNWHEFNKDMYIPVGTWGLYSNKVSTVWRSKRSASGTYSVPVASVLDATNMTKEEAEKFFLEVK